MPSGIDATVGGESANSYVTLEEANAYFDDRLNAAAWDDASEENRTRALLQATRRLEQEEYEGEPVDPPVDADVVGSRQALKWPRHATDDDAGWTFDEEAVPEIVRRAQMELALAYLAADSDRDADTGLEGFAQVAVGPIEVTPRHAHRAGTLPENVRRILRPVLRTSRGTVRLRRA
ncbi:MAG: DnaT-like ssDNA-binding protein [Gemmatimonadota bacterium]